MTDQSAEILRLREANAWLNGANKKLRAQAKAQRNRAQSAEAAVRSQRIELDSLRNRLRKPHR